MKRKGRIITFEGIDQSGKETQSRLLTGRLKDLGYSVGHLYFPDYDTAIGKELRAFLDGEKTYSSIVRQMLYAANRYEKLEEINTMLEEKDFVIIDRYIPSGLAYGLVNGIDGKWASIVESKLPQPEIVVLLDISSAVSRQRKSEETRDIYEKRYDFLDAVRAAYLQLAEEQHWLVVDASKTIPEVHRELWEQFSGVLKKYVSC